MEEKLIDRNINIRPYRKKDFDEILFIFMCNTPNYFSIVEENDLIHYLKHEIDEYYVIEIDGEIIGSGGINFFDPSCGRISWDMIHPEFHGKGYGTALLNYRLNRLKELEIQNISVRTSQYAFIFYNKQGFQIKEIVEDFWAEGFDLYEMTYSV